MGDDRLDRARQRYEQAVFGGETEALAAALDELDSVEADLEWRGDRARSTSPGSTWRSRCGCARSWASARVSRPPCSPSPTWRRAPATPHGPRRCSPRRRPRPRRAEHGRSCAGSTPPGPNSPPAGAFESVDMLSCLIGAVATLKIWKVLV